MATEAALYVKHVRSRCCTWCRHCQWCCAGNCCIGSLLLRLEWRIAQPPLVKGLATAALESSVCDLDGSLPNHLCQKVGNCCIEISLCDLRVHHPTTFIRGLTAALESSLCDLKGAQPNHLLSEYSSQVWQDHTTHVAPVAVHRQIKMVTRGTAVQLPDATSCALCPYLGFRNPKPTVLRAVPTDIAFTISFLPYKIILKSQIPYSQSAYCYFSY